MINYGDITQIYGYNVPITDAVIGGSPCQDLSIAGNRAGLDGECSGLFMEQIRLIKEMRENDRANGRADEFIRPRYMLWENVPGAFSSNKGEDFRIVLEETARVADESAVIPRPEKWSTSGCIMGEGWSIAWRVLDAQFWGVPQRRRRIALVADFGGQSAPEILFIRKGVSRDIESSGKAGEGTAEAAENCAGADNRAVAYSFDSLASNSMKSKNPYSGCRQVEIAKTLDTTDSSPCKNQGGIAIVCTATQQGGAEIRTDDKAPTVTAAAGMSGNNQPVVALPYTLKIRGGCEGGGKGALIQEDKSATLATNNDQYLFHPISIGLNGEKSVSPTLIAGMSRAVGTTQDNLVICQSVTYPGAGITSPKNASNPQPGDPCHTLSTDSRNILVESVNVTVGEKFAVRRLTPLECERLQGYPDGWTDIGEYTDSTGKKRKASDAARYKALGNSIALPPWKWVLKRISACYERDATMASLFDGIGGFPLLWEQINGKGSCLWTSEIEEFPMAVTRRRFGGEDV